MMQEANADEGDHEAVDELLVLALSTRHRLSDFPLRFLRSKSMTLFFKSERVSLNFFFTKEGLVLLLVVAINAILDEGNRGFPLSSSIW
jgi:hypothetical protein